VIIEKKKVRFTKKNLKLELVYRHQFLILEVLLENSNQSRPETFKNHVFFLQNCPKYCFYRSLISLEFSNLPSARKKWTNSKFVTTHPSGTLATSLIQVKEIMATDKEIPLVSVNDNIKTAINEMSKKKLGLVCCKEKSGKINILTDGDLRRHANNLHKKKIFKICNNNPNWISDSAAALSAIEKMNSLKITSLLVAKNQDINNQVIEYNEPQAIVSCDRMGYTEIDQKGKGNFTKNPETNALGYSDLKKAYTQGNLINPNHVQIKEYQSIDQLENERGNINYEMSSEDIQRIELQKRQEEENEERRLYRIQQRDSVIADNYSSVHQNMLGYRANLDMRR